VQPFEGLEYYRAKVMLLYELSNIKELIQSSADKTQATRSSKRITSLMNVILKDKLALVESNKQGMHGLQSIALRRRKVFVLPKEFERDYWDNPTYIWQLLGRDIPIMKNDFLKKQRKDKLFSKQETLRQMASWLSNSEIGRQLTRDFKAKFCRLTIPTLPPPPRGSFLGASSGFNKRFCRFGEPESPTDSTTAGNDPELKEASAAESMVSKTGHP